MKKPDLGAGIPIVQPARARPWVVLLVDDEDDILTTYKALLETSMGNVRVLTARSGREGLDIIDCERIDLIIADFKMPGMDGVEFLYQARKRMPTIPRMMFTALATEDLARRAFVETFVVAFLSKSTDPERIVDQVRAQLRYEPGGDASAPPASPKGTSVPSEH